MVQPETRLQEMRGQRGGLCRWSRGGGGKREEGDPSGHFAVPPAPGVGGPRGPTAQSLRNPFVLWDSGHEVPRWDPSESADPEARAGPLPSCPGLEDHSPSVRPALDKGCRRGLEPPERQLGTRAVRHSTRKQGPSENVNFREIANNFLAYHPKFSVNASHVIFGEGSPYKAICPIETQL